MRTNPFNDSWLFLIGEPPDHDALGGARYLLVALYAASLIGSIAVATIVVRASDTSRPDE